MCHRGVDKGHSVDDRVPAYQDPAGLWHGRNHNGYRVFIHKYKKGWSWHLDDVHIELLDVRHLGPFLEMEILSAKDGFEANRASYDRLFSVLHDLGLGDGAVEERSYQEMLRPYEPR